MDSPTSQITELEKGNSGQSNSWTTSTSCSQIAPLSPIQLSPLRKILQWRPWKISMKDPNRKSNVNNFQATSTSCSSIVPLSPGRLFPLRKILQCRPWKITIKDPNRKSNIRIRKSLSQENKISFANHDYFH
jgi:hypothetical protein